MEQKKPDDQAIRQQRAESLLDLAAGVAHRLNNILSGVLGGAFMVKQKLDESSETYKNAELIEVAATEASALAEQLLTFTKQIEEPDSVIDLHCLLDDAVFFFKHTLNRRVDIFTEYCDARPSVRGEPRQLLQAVLNLGYLAGKAVERGGELKITTREVSGAKGDDTQTDLRQISIDLRHTGAPYDPEQFDDSYDTAYEIIRRHNGTLNLSDDATAFTITLPVQSRRTRGAQKNNVKIPQGHGTILVVDDESSTRKLLHRFLTSLGYNVLTAADGEQAVSIYQSNASPVDLVILDLSMPVMDGPACFDALKKIDPNVSVMVASGYKHDHRLTELMERGAKGIAEKPFVPADIAAQISQIITERQP